MIGKEISVDSMTKHFCQDHICLEKYKATMKAKGLPGKTLKADMYEVGKSTQCEFDGLKKINKRVSKKEHASGISHFSVVARSMTRTFNKTQWQGMNFNEEDGTYYPKGYECD